VSKLSPLGEKMQPKKPIPYGLSDFKDVITNYYYIDKTHFIPLIEQYGNFLYLIRPRRFGKSLFLNMLDLYYNVKWKDNWELFKGLYIYDNPTPKRHTYHIIKFDFSAVSTKGDVDENFSEYCNRKIQSFLDTYDLDYEIDKIKPAHLNLNNLFEDLKQTHPDLKIYIIIDEYDNFINNILMNDKPLYEKMVSSTEAIYKEFFKLLKALTNENDSLLKKMFFAGVSPLALFDVTSGSNIGKNITNEYMFNDMVGVTKDEFREIVKYYDLDKKYFNEEFLDSWYNNYKFNPDTKHTIFNTDMVLYYIDAIRLIKNPPRELVDINVRTDYAKLKYLVHTNNKLNGNFNAFQTLFTKGIITVDKIEDSFSAFTLTKKSNFISLLYYLGLVTIDRQEMGDVVLKIPNQTIQNIMANFINTILEDTKTLEVDLLEFHQGVKYLAFKDDLRVFYYLANILKDNTSIRNLITQESDIRMFYLTYFSLNRLYAAIPEIELNQGYADIFLVKAMNIEEDIPNILIEFKFLKKDDRSKIDATLQKAKEQLEQYSKTKKFRVDKKIIIIFRGFEIEYCEFFGGQSGK